MKRETMTILNARLPDIKRQWERSQPFRWAVIDSFLPDAFAEKIYDQYPKPQGQAWDETTYTHQRKKFTKTEGFEGSLKSFFDLMASQELMEWIEELTGIRQLMSDPTLTGGGLHQIGPGGFLDVHIDYNRHPQFKWHRRLNLILYMNKNWLPQYKGQLELWDLAGRKKTMLDEVFPDFNRAVIFETNQISYHGHPHPVACPPGMTRKSIALYYYTEERDDAYADAPEHNTIYRQTTGITGRLKTSASAFEAAMERVNQQGVVDTTLQVMNKIARGLRGQPPENS